MVTLVSSAQTRGAGTRVCLEREISPVKLLAETNDGERRTDPSSAKVCTGASPLYPDSRLPNFVFAPFQIKTFLHHVRELVSLRVFLYLH